MANEKGMSEDKKARLEAIRAANAAKQAQNGGEPAPAVPIAVTPAESPPVVVAAAAPSARPGAVGANMSEDKKAKLEAIRAANAAKRAESGVAPSAVSPVTAAAAPVAAARPATTATPRPAARAPAKPQLVEEDRVSRRVQLVRLLVGAVFGLIMCLLLATMTGYYLRGAIVGIVLGALAGVLVLGWPPQHTTGE